MRFGDAAHHAEILKATFVEIPFSTQLLKANMMIVPMNLFWFILRLIFTKLSLI